MGDLALENIKNAVLAFKNESQELVKSVYDHEEVIDYLNHEISKSLVQANQLEISEKDSMLTGALFHVVNDLERIGDHAENVAEFAEIRVEKPIKYSEEAIDELDEMSSKVFKLLVIALEIFHDNDIERANTVIPPLEQEIDDMEKSLRKRHIKRLKKKQCTARAGTIFIDILSNLERVADHSTNIAYSILDDS